VFLLALVCGFGRQMFHRLATARERAVPCGQDFHDMTTRSALVDLKLLCHLLSSLSVIKMSDAR
jgi:hypothetical protein